MRVRVRLRRDRPCAPRASWFSLSRRLPRPSLSCRGSFHVLQLQPRLDGWIVLIFREFLFHPLGGNLRAAADALKIAEFAGVLRAVRKESAGYDVEERIERVVQLLIGALALQPRTSAARCR